jgi:acetoacetate decarboxylase
MVDGPPTNRETEQENSHENLICPDSGRPIACDANGIAQKMEKTQVNLKIIPDIDGSLKIAQLVAYNLEAITVKGAWEGPARLALFPHVNAPVADLPVKSVLSGMHFLADLTLPYGWVLHD